MLYYYYYSSYAGGGAILAAATFLAAALFLLRHLRRFPAHPRSSFSSSSNSSSSSPRLPPPPGSLGLPLIGETLALLRWHWRHRTLEFMHRRIQAHGPTFKTSLFGCPTVVLTGPSGNKLVFTLRTTLVPPTVVSVLGHRTLLSLQASHALRIRRAFMSFLHPQALQRYTASVDSSVRDFIRTHIHGRPHVSLLPLFKRLSFSLACELLLGIRDPLQQSLLFHPFQTLSLGIFGSLPVRLPGTRFSRAVHAGAHLRRRFAALVSERRRKTSPEHKPDEAEKPKLKLPAVDLLDCLLSFSDDEGRPLSDAEICDNLLFFLFAGHDTTSHAAALACRYLALDPACLEQVYQEHKEIAKRKRDGEEPLDWEDLQDMKLSWRVVQETLRLQPIVKGNFREVTEDIQYDGYMIPKSWKVVWFAETTHRDPKYFPDPDRFHPARFEGQHPPFTFVPFGGGPRMCPGSDFARMEILIFLHYLVTQFSWTLEDPHEPICEDPLPAPINGLSILLQQRA